MTTTLGSPPATGAVSGTASSVSQCVERVMSRTQTTIGVWMIPRQCKRRVAISDLCWQHAKQRVQLAATVRASKLTFARALADDTGKPLEEVLAHIEAAVSPDDAGGAKPATNAGGDL